MTSDSSAGVGGGDVVLYTSNVTKDEEMRQTFGINRRKFPNETV